MEIKSVFDGWEKQWIGGEPSTAGGGSKCAFIHLHESGNDDQCARIGKHLMATFIMPPSWSTASGVRLRPDSNPDHAIVYANDVLRLTPAQFAEIDRLSQIEEQVRPLVESVVIEERVEV